MVDAKASVCGPCGPSAGRSKKWLRLARATCSPLPAGSGCKLLDRGSVRRLLSLAGHMEDSRTPAYLAPTYLL